MVITDRCRDVETISSTTSRAMRLVMGTGMSGRRATRLEENMRCLDSMAVAAMAGATRGK
jgi:hypothetical protein